MTVFTSKALQLVVAGALTLAALAAGQILPTFAVSKAFTTRGGIHSTRHGTIRLVFVHEDKWFVFHGGPNMYQFSSDGMHWTGKAIAQFGARSHFVRGDTIHNFAHIDASPRFGVLRNLRVNYRDYGLDEETRRRVAALYE